MVYSPEWVNDKIGIWTAGYVGGFFGYLLYNQGLAKKALNLCLSFGVASEVLPGRNGIKKLK